MGVIWDMDIRVTGSREKFQSDLNFSIQVEDVHNIPQIAELRRRFFKEFEDSDRGEDLRVLAPKVVKDKKKITENTLVNKSVSSDDGTVNNTGNSETIGSTGIAESYTELENTGDSLEDILKDISTNGVFGENRKSDNREGTEIDVGKINQSLEGTNLETGNTVSFKESIKQRREGIVSSGESLESNGEENNGSMKDTKQKLEGINQKSENNENKEKNVKQTQEVNKSEVGKTKNRNGIIYVEVKYDDDGWAYGESTDEDEIEDNNSDNDLGNEDTDDFPTEDEFDDNDMFNDTEDEDKDESVDEDVDDFPDNDFNEDEEDSGGDFEREEEFDDVDFPDEDDGNDDVDFPGETDKDEDETEETQDSEEDDPFSGWGNDFDEESDEDDDFSPMDSSDDVEDPDYAQSDSKATKNFLDMVKSKAKEGKKEDRKEKAIPVNKGKSVDESWRKTSEVGDIEDLWSFDSMNDLSGDEFDNLLYGESELDKRCENCSDVEVPDVEEISKTREARKRIGNSKRGVDAVEVKENTNDIEVSEDDEEDIFGSLGFEDEEDATEKDVTDEEDDDGIFGSLDFTDEEDVEENENLTREIEKDIKGYDAENIYQKGSKQVIASNKQNQKPAVKEVKVEEKKADRGDYKTLRDFVKANKGCTVSEALVLFSKKEIEKDLKMGRVYQRRDKLFI